MTSPFHKPCHNQLKLIQFFIIFFILIASWVTPDFAEAGSCGGNGQRACCLLEADFGSCTAGNTEHVGCDGDCGCGNIPFTNAITHCVTTPPPVVISSCGGNGQRACCVLEGTACGAGNAEITGCSGNCLCGGLNPAGVSSITSCRAVTPCGSDGQRACCVTEPRFIDNLADAGCRSGLVEVSGTSGNNLCGGLNPTGLGSITSCVPCGSQVGARACGGVAGVGGTCDAGMTEILGICTSCGLKDQPVCIGEGGRPRCEPGFRSNALGFCQLIDGIAEPTTNATQSTVFFNQAYNQPLRGYADLHAHMLSNNAFGGLVLWGKAFDEGGINRALPADDYAYDLNAVDRYGLAIPDFAFQGQSVHGPLHVEDLVGLGQEDGAIFNRGISPDSFFDAALGNDFSGWPKWTSVTHQQMYYKWLERAYEGGMRLMVLHAVNNEVLCKANKRIKGRNCAVNMQDIDLQLDQAHALERYIDGLNGGTGKGWFRIVTSAAKARRAIEGGKLAVVLGVETDSLFECKDETASSGGKVCDNNRIRSEVQRYYNKGVRHIFPVHDFDNAFGGAATFGTLINSGNRLVRGEYFDVRECKDEGYNFKFDFNAVNQLANSSLKCNS
jgi:hypothetical protein